MAYLIKQGVTMAAVIDFYFDFSSPYAYFASTRIEALAGELGMQVNWQPILLGPMFKATGSAALVDIPLKGAYSRHDMQRTARLHGISFTMPDPFPVATVAAARIMLHVGQSDTRLARAYAQRVFHAYYVDGINIGEPEAALRLAGELGLDVDAVAAATAGDAIKSRLRDSVQAAMDRGVFGAPFMFVGDEPFWGFDRLDAIRQWVRTQGAQASSG